MAVKVEPELGARRGSSVSCESGAFLLRGLGFGFGFGGGACSGAGVAVDDLDAYDSGCRMRIGGAALGPGVGPRDDSPLGVCEASRLSRGTSGAGEAVALWFFRFFMRMP